MHISKSVLFIVVILAIVAIVGGAEIGCTKNSIARNWGGSTSLTLPAGQKLVMITWKEGDSLWYLYRPMRANEQAETYTFQESSSFGLMQGTVSIAELEKK